MAYRVTKPFVWSGEEQKVGSFIELPDEHPRLGGLVRGGFVRYVEPPSSGDPKVVQAKAAG